MTQHLVIVGGGQAATQAVQTSRQLGFDGDITLIGEEALLPYQRPPLSKKYLAGMLERERLFLRPAKFYEDRRVNLRLGSRVEEVDLASRRLSLASSDHVSYDYLLLALGSRPRRLDVPGENLRGVHYLRTIGDVDAITHELEPGMRVVIVGGGYIGLEVAAVCVGLGLAVTVLEAAGRILSRVVCDETAGFYTNAHRNAGVDIRCDAAVTEFIGKSRLAGVRTAAAEEFPCDCAIVGIGVTPNTELAARAGLETDNGIVVDGYGRTGDPRVAAAGDCTNQLHPWLGERIRLESVHNAVEQSKAASHTLLTAPSAFSEVPWFWSDQYDLKLQIVGISRDYDDVVVRGEPSTRRFSVFYFRADKLIAVDAINDPKHFLLGKKLLPDTPAIAPEAIADTSVDLQALHARS